MVICNIKKALLVKEQKINKEDTLTQTFGCRHSNPDICSNNGVIGKCAFVSDDCICKMPPKSWKKKYEKLKNKKDSGDNND